MSSSEPIAILEVTIPQPPANKFERERQAFYRMLPELLVDAREQETLSATEKSRTSTRLACVQRVLEKVGPCDIYVGLVDVGSDRPSRSGVVRVLERGEERA